MGASGVDQRLLVPPCGLDSIDPPENDCGLVAAIEQFLRQFFDFLCVLPRGDTLFNEGALPTRLVRFARHSGVSKLE
jgi:hypothetical protein